MNHLLWLDALLWYWLDGQKFLSNHELDGAMDPSESLSIITRQIFSMHVLTGRYKISECLPLSSSTAGNSSKYFYTSCQKRLYAGFCGRLLSFCKSHNKSVSFDSIRIQLYILLDETSTFIISSDVVDVWEKSSFNVKFGVSVKRFFTHGTVESFVMVFFMPFKVSIRCSWFPSFSFGTLQT